MSNLEFQVIGVPGCPDSELVAGIPRTAGQQAKSVLGSTIVDGAVIRKKLDEHLGAIVATRVSELGGNEKIARELDRRAEIAVKSVGGQIDHMVRTLLDKAIRDHVSDTLKNMKVTTSVSVDVSFVGGASNG